MPLFNWESMTSNGHSADTVIQTNQILYTLANGIRLELTPLTLIGQRMYKDQATTRFPVPDAAPYEKEDPTALVKERKTSAMRDPDYVNLVQEALIRRDFAYRERVLQYCVEVSSGWGNLAQKYARMLDGLDSPMIYLKMPDDKPAIPYEVENRQVQLLYSVLATPDEINTIMDLIQGRLPLSEGEILNGFRYFRRLEVSGDGSTPDVTNP